MAHRSCYGTIRDQAPVTSRQQPILARITTKCAKQFFLFAGCQFCEQFVEFIQNGRTRAWGIVLPEEYELMRKPDQGQKITI